MGKSKSFDAITRRAVTRMTDKCNGDWEAVLRITEKARNLRAHRSAKALLGSLRRPIPAAVLAEQVAA